MTTTARLTPPLSEGVTTKSIASKCKNKHSVEDAPDDDVLAVLCKVLPSANFLINIAVDRMLKTLRLNLDLDPLELIRKTVCDAGDAGRLRCPLLQQQNS